MIVTKPRSSGLCFGGAVCVDPVEGIFWPALFGVTSRRSTPGPPDTSPGDSSVAGPAPYSLPDRVDRRISLSRRTIYLAIKTTKTNSRHNKTAADAVITCARLYSSSLTHERHRRAFFVHDISNGIELRVHWPQFGPYSRLRIPIHPAYCQEDKRLWRSFNLASRRCDHGACRQV